MDPSQAANPMAVGVASNLVAAALMRGGAELREQRAKALRKAEFGDDLDALATEFNRALREAIADYDDESPTKELASVADDWDAIARELSDEDGLDAETAADRLSFESKQDAVEQIAEAIAAVDGYDLDDTPQLARELKHAVADAYGAAIEDFAERISETERGEAFVVEAQIESLDRLADVQAEIEQLAEDYRPPKFYWKFDLPEDDLDRASRLIDPDQFEFANRPELEGVGDSDRVFLHGPGGSGKSRAMAELVRTAGDDVAHVVIAKDAFKHQEHLARLRQESFDGDVLLVWDDIHAIAPEQESAVFRRVVSELETLLGDEGYDLHVLAAARTENLDAVPGDPRKDGDKLWSEFETVELEILPFDVLANVFQYALAENEVEITEEVATKFLQKAVETDPSPLYVTSVVETAKDEELTEDDIEDLPESALAIWQDQYTDIEEANDERLFVLQSAKLLNELYVSAYRSLLEGVYVHVLGREKAKFDSPVKKLVERQWLVPVTDEDSSEIRYVVHDVKLEAIDVEISEWLWEFSEFLLDGPVRYLPVEVDDRQALHGNLALQFREDTGPRSNEQAERHYQYILQNLKSDDAVVHTNYALLLEERGKLEEAKQHYQKAIEIDPTLPEAHYDYGALLYDKLDERELAIDHFETATEVAPGDPRAHYNYANILFEELEKYEKAAHHYQQAINARPEFLEANYSYANLSYELGNYEKASYHYQQAIDISPDRPEIRTTYATLLFMQLDRPKEAKDHLETSIEDAIDAEKLENAIVSLKRLVHICRMLGHADDARKYCEQALNLAEDNGNEDRFNEHRHWFEGVQALLLDADISVVYQHALKNVLRRNFGITADILKTIWDTEDETHAPPAGVALAAFLDLFDEVEITLTCDDLVSAITPEDLPDPARAVYDHLETGSTELSPDDLRARADDHDDHLDALEAQAFAVLLNELKG